MTVKIRLGISSCLAGENVRYDGGNRRNRYLVESLGSFVDYVTVCPEVESGMTVPREPMHLVDDPLNPRMVVRSTGEDLTDHLKEWTKTRVSELQENDLWGFIFKSSSPSCGLEGVKVFDRETGRRKIGSGISSSIFAAHFPKIPMIDENKMDDLQHRRGFIEAIFMFKRWREFREGPVTEAGLVDFHARHKLILLSHSRNICTRMGRLVSGGKGLCVEERLNKYEEFMHLVFKYKATRNKSADMLMHCAGLLKKDLLSSEKAELVDRIDRFRVEKLDLEAPLSFVKDLAERSGTDYLLKQYFLYPDPLETVLSVKA